MADTRNVRSTDNTGDTRRVTCSECGRRSEIMSPADDAGEVTWKCPQFLENGIDQCGTFNTITV